MILSFSIIFCYASQFTREKRTLFSPAPLLVCKHLEEDVSAINRAVSSPSAAGRTTPIDTCPTSLLIGACEQWLQGESFKTNVVKNTKQMPFIKLYVVN
jgi:hypothetical protein